MSWEKPLAKSDQGIVGQVYYINQKMIFKDGKEWTKNTPVTLNPKYGSTIERMLKMQADIPKQMKSDLLSFRSTEVKLSSGIILKIWISDEAAPGYWNPTHEQMVQKQLKESGPMLYGADGRLI